MLGMAAAVATVQASQARHEEEKLKKLFHRQDIINRIHQVCERALALRKRATWTVTLLAERIRVHACDFPLLQVEEILQDVQESSRFGLEKEDLVNEPNTQSKIKQVAGLLSKVTDRVERTDNYA